MAARLRRHVALCAVAALSMDAHRGVTAADLDVSDGSLGDDFGEKAPLAREDGDGATTNVRQIPIYSLAYYSASCWPVRVRVRVVGFRAYVCAAGEWFDVDTSDVLARCWRAVRPSSGFMEKTGGRPDMYGPVCGVQ